MLNNLFLTINHTVMKNRQFTIIPFLRVILLFVLCQAFVNKSWAQIYPDTSTWKVDLNSFAYTAEVQGILIIEGFESSDPNDRVAAFKGTECRGVADQLVEINNRFYAFITLGTNDFSDVVEFFVYDASLGKILPCPNKLTFVPFDLIGNVLNMQPYPIETFNVQITFKKDDVLCTADNYGYAKAKVIGGTGPYQYHWSNGATTDSIGRLIAGKYILSVTDANAVVRIDSINIVNLNRPIEVPNLVRTPIRPLCMNDDATLVAFTSETESPVYRWYNLWNVKIGEGPTLLLENLQDSLIVICETLVRNCISVRDSIAVFVDPLPDASFSIGPNNHFLERLELTFTPNGLTTVQAGSAFAWNFGDGTTSILPVPKHIYWLPGTYTVSLTVTTPNGCVMSTTQQILIKDQLTFDSGNVICSADNYGFARVKVTGGTAPFQFLWSTGSTIDSIRRLSAGEYFVSVTDANAKVWVDSITIVNIDRPVSPPVIIRTPDRPLCGGDDVTLTAYTDEKEAPIYRWFNSFDQLLKEGPILTLTTVEDSLVVYCEVIVRNCISERDSSNIFVEPLPNPSFSFDPFGYIIIGRDIKFTPDVLYPARLGYQYFWDFGDGSFESARTSSHSYLVPGVYKVTLEITTPSGCSRSFYRFINIAGFDFVKEIDILFNITDVQCTSDKTGEITAQAINGTAPYRYNWSTGATTATISNLKPGVYGLTVTDTDGAVSSAEARVRSRIDSVISARPLLSDSIICPGDDIWIAGASSQSNATFHWFDGPDLGAKLIYNGNPLLIFDVEKSRTLWLEARVGTCTQAKRTRVEIKVPEIALAIQVSKSIVATGEEIDFSIPVPNLLDAQLYSWDFGDGSAVQRGLNLKHSFNRAGLFTVVLTLQLPQGCIKQVSRIISVQGETKEGLEARLEVLAGQCPEDEAASIKVVVTKGTGPFTYQWSNGLTGAEIRGRLDGNYNVLITDLSTGQSITQSARVTPANTSIPSPQLILNGNEVICPGAAAWILGVSSLAGAQIHWYDAPVGGNLLFVGSVFQINQVLSSRSIYAEVVLGGCRSAQRSSVLVAPLNLDAAFVAEPQVAPVGTNFSFRISQTQNTHSYYWSYGDAGLDTGLLVTHTFAQAGLYEVQLTAVSIQGCKVASSQVVRVTGAGVGLDAALSITAPQCAVDSNGVIAVKVLNGSAPFAYNWSTGATGASISGLKAGTYRITVTDQSGNTWNEEIELSAKVPAIQLPNITVNGNQTICAGDNIWAVAVTNVADAEYRWYDQAQDGNLLFNGASMPLLQVKKGLILHVEAYYQGCFSPGRQAIVIPVNSPESSFFVSETIIKAGTSINLGPNVIVPNYTYQWDFGNGSGMTGTQLTHKYDFAGTYSIVLKVTDPQGCQSSSARNVFVVDNVVLDIALDVVQATCTGKNDGTVRARVFNGKAPYSYRWNTGSTGTELNNIPPGIYELTVTDSEGGTVVESVIMKSKVPEIAAPEVRMSPTDQTCFGTQAQLNAYTPLSNNLVFRWFDAPVGGTLLGTGNSFNTPTLEGNLSLYVEVESGGCVSTQRTPAEVKVINPDPEFVVDRQNVVEGGAVKFEPKMKNLNWSYTWLFEGSGLSQGMLTEPKYLNKGEFDVQLTVLTPEGCTRTLKMEDYINVVSATELDLAITTRGTICDNDAAGALFAEAYNGAAPFTYRWSTGASSSTIQAVKAGTYSLTLTDRNGVQVIKSKKVTFRFQRPKLPSIIITSPIPICAGTTLQFKSLENEGIEKFEWRNWENSLIGNKDTLSLTNVKDFVRVFLRTGNGVCFSDEASIDLQIQSPSSDFTIQPLTQAVLGDTLKFSALNQNLNRYEWSFGDGASSTGTDVQHIFNVAGTYDIELRVADSDGCRGQLSKKGLIKVTEALPLALKFVTKGVICAADTTGQVQSLPEGGYPPYRYAWNNGRQNATIKGLAAGKYSVTITDRKGNILVQEVEIQNANQNTPEPKVLINGGAVVCAGSGAVLLASVAGESAANYRWYRDPLALAVAEGAAFLLNRVETDTLIWAQTLLNGCSSALTQVAIKVQRPNAAFSANPGNVVNEGDLLQFIPANQQVENSYLWRFGDGGWSSRARPYYIYNQPGSYAVQLTLTDAQGCQNTLVREAWVEVKRAPGFAPSVEPTLAAQAEATAQAMSLTVSPNPFAQNLWVEIQLKKAATLQLECIDLQGRRLWQEQQLQVQGPVLKLDLSERMLNRAVGVYFLRLSSSAGENQLIQIVKQ